MRKLLIFLLIQILTITSLFSLSMKSDIAFYAGLESVHDNRELGNIPLKSAATAELNCRVFNLDFGSLSFGPSISAKLTSPTTTFRNTRILGYTGFSFALNGSYQINDNLSLSIEAGTGVGAYNSKIAYASIDGAIRADYELENAKLSAKTGLSYKRETISIICQIGIGIDFYNKEI